jgi:subtilisin family serine protease
MRKEVITLCVIVSLTLSLFIIIIANAGLSPQRAPTENAHAGSAEYVKDKILVRFKPEARKDGMVVPDIAAAAHAKVGATTIRDFKEVPGLQLAQLPKGVAVPDAIAQYKQNPNVLYAEPDYLRHKDVIPNDPYFNILWGLHNTGQTVKGESGTPGADIKAPAAWDKTTGSSDIAVAVIDTGVDYNEPDLAPNIVNGWDFITNSSDPMDRDGHGTHAAGIIAAVGNNGIGVTGVMWKAQIMPLRVIGPDGASVSDEIAAISYADSHGARIINMSLGGSYYSQAEKDAIDASPAVCMCSAGNDGNDTDQMPHYPSSYSSSNIIAVAATDQNDALASFSNYGPHSVQVAAPGTNILSTFPPSVQLSHHSFNNFTAWSAQAPWRITNDTHARSLSSAAASIPGGNSVNASITLKNPLDLTSKCGTTLVFNVKLDTAGDHGLFYIEASRDGIHWDLIDSWWGNSDNWMSLRYSLTNYDTSPYFNVRFGLTTDGSTGSNSVYIDDVNISAFDPSSAKEDYAFLSGTSMATPFVSGLAGLVKAMNPSYTNLQIKDAIVKNVDAVNSLSGKILTGGRINASKTLSGNASPRAPPLSITSARLVSNHAQHFERDLTTAGIAGARVASSPMFYKKIANAP